MSVSMLSLATPILPKDKLYPTPSMQEGLRYEDEFDLRLIGCELIQTSGRLLRLPQTAMATAQVLFQRYYYSKSFVKNSMEHYAMGAIFLSGKIEECPRRLRDVMNVFYHIKQMRTGKIIKPMPIDQQYNETKNQIIKAERRILKELGFCVHVKHPHKIISIYLTAMECFQQELVQKAWNYMNDSLRTDVFLRYKPEIVACACIYLSARELHIPLPVSPPWFTIFGADEESLKIISLRLLHLYSHKTKSPEELEKIVQQCRDRQLIEKQRSREATAIQGQADLVPNDSFSNLPALATPAATSAASSQLAQSVAAATALASSFAMQSKLGSSSSSATPPQTVINTNSLNIKVNIINMSSSTSLSQLPSQVVAATNGHHHHKHHTTSGVVDDAKRKEAGHAKESSHKKHSKRRSSKHRSRSSSRSSRSSETPKHKKHKKRSSRDRKSKSRSRSASPSSTKQHKKKDRHHHHHHVSSSSSSRHHQATSRHSHSSSSQHKSRSSSKQSSRYQPPHPPSSHMQHDDYQDYPPPPPSHMPMYYMY